MTKIDDDEVYAVVGTSMNWWLS